MTGPAVTRLAWNRPGPGPVGPRVGGGPLGPPGAVAPSCGPGLLRCARPRRPLRGALRAAPPPCALPRRASPAPPCSLGLSRRSWRRVLACSASAAGRRSLPRGRSLARAVAAWPRPSPGSARPRVPSPGHPAEPGAAPGPVALALQGRPWPAPWPLAGPLRGSAASPSARPLLAGPPALRPCGALPGPSGGRPPASRAPPPGGAGGPAGHLFTRPARRRGARPRQGRRVGAYSGTAPPPACTVDQLSVYQALASVLVFQPVPLCLALRLGLRSATLAPQGQHLVIRAPAGCGFRWAPCRSSLSAQIPLYSGAPQGQHVARPVSCSESQFLFDKCSATLFVTFPA